MSADPVGINGVAEIKKLNDSSLNEKNNAVDLTKSGSPSSKSAEANSLPTSPKDAKAENIIHSPEYQKLIEYGLDDKVANRLEEIYKTGLILFFTLYVDVVMA